MSASINVCFHGIGDPGDRPSDEAAYWIGADLFRRALDLVVDRPDVRLSFDDGNRSDIELAFPELRGRGITATFFVLAGRLGRPDSVGGAEIRTLRDGGMDVGSHGMDHVPWRGLDRACLARELVDSGRMIEAELGSAVSTAACPLGRYDRRVLSALRKAGYTRVYTSDRAVARDGAWLQPRFSVRSTDGIADVQRYLDHGRRLATRLRDDARILAKSAR